MTLAATKLRVDAGTYLVRASVRGARLAAKSRCKGLRSRPWNSS
jgi:hypothetical protein